MTPNLHDPSQIIIGKPILTDLTAYPEPFLLIVAAGLSILLLLRTHDKKSIFLITGFTLIAIKHLGWFLMPYLPDEHTMLMYRLRLGFAHLFGWCQFVGLLMFTLYILAILNEHRSKQAILKVS